MTIKIGDVVCLKSGGPKMTVDHVREDKHAGLVAHCVWHTGRELKYTALPADAFDIVQPSKPKGFDLAQIAPKTHMPHAWDGWKHMRRSKNLYLRGYAEMHS